MMENYNILLRLGLTHLDSLTMSGLMRIYLYFFYVDIYNYIYTYYH